MKKQIGAALMGGALFLGACHTPEHAAPKPAVEKQQSDSLRDAPIATQTRVANLITEALNNFRREAETNHMVKVLIGACVGWPTGTGNEIAVTINPGLAEAANDKGNVLVTIFSRPDKSDGKTTLTYMDGTAEYTDGSTGEHWQNLDQMKLFMKDENLKSTSLERQISTEPVEGADERWAYIDIESGLQVIKTDVFERPFTSDNVQKSCNELQPGYSEAAPSQPKIRT